jgi:hypothetical protein
MMLKEKLAQTIRNADYQIFDASEMMKKPFGTQNTSRFLHHFGLISIFPLFYIRMVLYSLG